MKIFVNYRRKDSADITGRIYDRLVAKFGKNAVFKDVDSIPLGVNFRDYLDEQVGQCSIFLSVIGQEWLDLKNEEGTRRLEEPNDFVRIEIESALKHKLPLIPVLVQGVEIILADELPASIRTLSEMNGLKIRSDPDFHKDVDRLILGIQKVAGDSTGPEVFFMSGWLLFMVQILLMLVPGIFLSVTGLIPDSAISIFIGMGIFVFCYLLLRNTLNRDFARGMRQIRSGKYKEAARSFENTIVLFSKYPFLDKWRIFFFLTGGRYGYREMAFINLGFTYTKLGDVIKAKENYKKCLRLYPKNLHAQHALELLEISSKPQESL